MTLVEQLHQKLKALPRGDRQKIARTAGIRPQHLASLHRQKSMTTATLEKVVAAMGGRIHLAFPWRGEDWSEGPFRPR
jgi:DNA-binding phage protein